MPWFKVKAQADNASVANISIYEPIGSWDLTAAQFIGELKALGDVSHINLDINSPGGDVFEALTIFNFLKRHNAHVTVTVAGIAASAASLIAMAGDTIIMPNNTMMMIHNPWTWAAGNADDLREQADMLDKVGASLFNTYHSRTGMDEAELKAMLATDTWLTAEECMAHGFCDQIIDPIKPQSSFNVAALPDAAKSLYAQTETLGGDDIAPVEEPDAVIEEAPEVPQTDLDDDVEALAEAVEKDILAYAKTVVELCALAGMPNKAGEFIAAYASLDDVRAQLLTAKANSYQPLDVAQPQQQAPVLPMASNVYARRNKVH